MLSVVRWEKLSTRETSSAISSQLKPSSQGQELKFCESEILHFGRQPSPLWLAGRLLLRTRCPTQKQTGPSLNRTVALILVSKESYALTYEAKDKCPLINHHFRQNFEVPFSEWIICDFLKTWSTDITQQTRSLFSSSSTRVMIMFQIHENLCECSNSSGYVILLPQ